MPDKGGAQSEPNQPEISAEPTKAFFVEMFTKDIPLEQAVLDLVDNSVDGAKRLAGGADANYAERWIYIKFDSKKFSISDNCGGFSRHAAIHYAFRFGRPKNAASLPGSIGRFGVGMKRALFKFGTHFVVQSATTEETWGVEVDVPKWEDQPEGNWNFPWKKDFDPDNNIGEENPGTEIVVHPLHRSVGYTFSTKAFLQLIVSLIKTRHRSFVAKGLKIEVNGERIQPVDLTIISNQQFKASVWNNESKGENGGSVSVRVIVGMAESAPRQAGWYIICNGRIILYADRRDVTGWGTVEEAADVAVPAYHGQFARFRGIATFESEDSSLIPWNTMKTDVDQDNPIWRATRVRMIEAMRPVIDFLNEVDEDVEERTRDKSPLYQALKIAPQVPYETLTSDRAFSAPEREELPAVQKETKIQFYKLDDDIDLLKSALRLNSAAAVGSRCFDLVLQRQKR